MTKLLWQPSEDRIKSSNMRRFIHFINDIHQLEIDTYDRLHEWSITHIPEFWAGMWTFGQIKASAPYTEIIDDLTKMPGARWFKGCRLNFAENLLRFRDDQVALVFKGEAQPTIRLTYAELYDEVSRVADALKKIGVQKGDRVGAFMPNMPQTVIAMLASVSLGAVWSSCSPDFGIKGVLDRFGQIKPKVIFTTDGYFFRGKKIDSLERIAAVAEKLPSLKQLVVIPYVDSAPTINHIPRSNLYQDFIAASPAGPITFEQLPFDHPLYIMYSSGTTGLPKCMVQSAGGILLHHQKELILHTDLKRSDKIFYYTTCGWMMWNWLVSSLAVGATVVLYDGNVFYPDAGVLWQMAQDEKITIFGTSAGYIAALEKSGLKPGNDYDLKSLRTILSTGSPLPVEGFEFVYTHIKKDVQLSSISGGSDLNGCFALGNPMGPVYAGELQCRGLGMKVDAFDENGRSVRNQKAELVCTAPFPSMPIYFWDDPEGDKYHAAYFDRYPGVWCHGDFIEINDRGGVVVYGRSDATLKPKGIRIGTAEIYRQVEQQDEIDDSVVIGQPWQNDVRIVLFVKLLPGHTLTQALQDNIRREIRKNVSPHHVPAKIIGVPDIPYTLNMKKVELAVRKVIAGEPVLNKDALRNPEALDFYANIEELKKE